MAINLVTYAAQTVTPQDDALIYENALIGSGMIYGGEVTIKSANVLRVAAGHGALCGRKFTIEATDIPISLTPSGSLLGRVYIHMDLSDVDEPISFMVETASSLTPVIQDSDININNGVYEINLATFEVDTSTISNLDNVAPTIAPASKAYTTEDGTALSIDDADYIPFYDSSTGKAKKIAVSDAKFGGGALYFTSVACAATTGDFATVSNANITANHVVVSVEYANPSAITSDVTWTTANGSVTLNGTCASATTCAIILVEKDN